MTDAASEAVLSAGTWNVDPAHSCVEFKIGFMGFLTVTGLFTEFSGTVEVGDDGIVSAGGAVDAGSVDTRNGKRDGQLRSADFFDAEKHPELSFRSSSVSRDGAAGYRIAGDLTIRGVTGEVELRARALGTGVDPWDQTRAGLEVRGQIDREEFGLTWNKAVEGGGLLVGKQVDLLLDISLIKA